MIHKIEIFILNAILFGFVWYTVPIIQKLYFTYILLPEILRTRRLTKFRSLHPMIHERNKLSPIPISQKKNSVQLNFITQMKIHIALSCRERKTLVKVTGIKITPSIGGKRGRVWGKWGVNLKNTRHPIEAHCYRSMVIYCAGVQLAAIQ